MCDGQCAVTFTVLVPHVPVTMQVRDKGAEKHKGFGFVTFALPEDAQRAVDELNNTSLAGRKLQVGANISAE